MILRSIPRMFPGPFLGMISLHMTAILVQKQIGVCTGKHMSHAADRDTAWQCKYIGHQVLEYILHMLTVGSCAPREMSH